MQYRHASRGGMFGIRVKTGHKNTAEDFRPGKTIACLVTGVCFYSPRASRRAKAGVRKRFYQSVIQQAVFTHMKRNRSSVREGLLFWTDLSVAGNYTYPEHTQNLLKSCENRLNSHDRRSGGPSAI
jgi:hypothetical protein